MSAEVIDRYAGRESSLTPNLNAFFDASLVFENYYSHTAATYKGLRGQLYSSYQYLDGYYAEGTGLDQISRAQIRSKTSTDLVSVIDILNENGYETSFVNAEPDNKQFTVYLESFRCDYVTSGHVADRTLTDKEVFKLLTKAAEQNEEPFFIGCYNIGTHHGYDSSDIKYGKGYNAVLNRFHNYDAQFGAFWDAFQSSAYADNTILILTADHATFNAPEYLDAFDSDQQYFVNTIPLIIYYKGVTHRIVDAEGRNSLGLAPTVLDLLDVENHDNYFLGSSLFVGEGTAYERITDTDNEYYYTGDGVELILDYDETIERIQEYYAISLR
jgi:phosphoglycerol transferase MdoB-like AlkP superfamily enzyme